MNTVKVTKKTTGSLWNYYRDETNNCVNDGMDNSVMGLKTFDYKEHFIGSATQNNLTKNDVEIVVPLKYVRHFSRSLNIPLIICEVELILNWLKNCMLISKAAWWC